VSENYQDRIVDGKVIQKGERECEQRYQTIKEVLDNYKRPFTVLDIGAAQGYFSFRIMQDFPEATCVMMESHESRTLLDLCKKNKKGLLLAHHAAPDHFERLSECEHFDVVLALNVIHHIGEPDRTFNALMKLGDDVIIETPPEDDKGACGQEHLKRIMELCKSGKIIGESQRHTDSKKSKIFHFERKNDTLLIPYLNAPPNVIPPEGQIKILSDKLSKKIINKRKKTEKDWVQGINLWTFLMFQGIYPERNKLSEMLTKFLEVDHEDLELWNMIISKGGIHLIDDDDKEHKSPHGKAKLKAFIDNLKGFPTIVWRGPIFNPTGISTHAREMVKALAKLGCTIQCSDIWHDRYSFNKGLEFLNKPINANRKDVVTVFFDYPQYWQQGHGKIFGGFIHEGTKLKPEWIPLMQSADKVWTGSKAIAKMFRFNGITRPIGVIPAGFDPELYKQEKQDKSGNFMFFSVNSWTGKEGDRKGTDLLLKAFDEEFKNEKDVRLALKISTFWQQRGEDFYQAAVYNFLGHTNEKIILNSEYLEDDVLAKMPQTVDCFVAPTRGEGFGLTILNAMACGLPVIVTEDKNSGHMDFCMDEEGKDLPGVLWIDTETYKQGDPQFYTRGNMLAEPDIKSLRKQMRWAYENRNELREMGEKNAEIVHKKWTWRHSAEKMIKFIKEGDAESESPLVWR